MSQPAVKSTPSSCSLLEELANTASAPLEQARSLPPACYSDASFLALELDRIFACEWLCIGRANDIPEAGDYLTFDAPQASVMAVRQKDGSIATLSRVCRHRGALLGEQGGGKAKGFVCPYHSWTYELDGRLRGAAAMSANTVFDRNACALPSFKTEIWEGFIFFSSAPDARPLAPRLADITQRVHAYRLAELRTAFVIEDVWDTNWKVAFENGTETYHHMGVHQQTLQPFFPTLGVICEPGTDSYNLHVAPAAESFDFDRPSAGGPGATQLNAALTEQELSRLLIVGIYPGLALVFAGSSVNWFSFTPRGVRQTGLRVGWLAPPRYFADANIGERIAHDRATLEAILAEDKASCSAVQRGLESRDAVAGPLSPIERTIAEFVRYLARRLAD